MTCVKIKARSKVRATCFFVICCAVIFFKNVNMKLTFQLDISAKDLAKALTTGKTAVQVSGLLAVEPRDGNDKHFDEGGKADDMKKDNVEVDGDSKANNEDTYTDHHIVKMGVSEVEKLPYWLLQGSWEQCCG
jgi:hypothetical protein